MSGIRVELDENGVINKVTITRPDGTILEEISDQTRVAEFKRITRVRSQADMDAPIKIEGSKMTLTEEQRQSIAFKLAPVAPDDYDDMVKNCSTIFSPLTFDVKDRNILLTCGKWKSQLSTAGGNDEFPKTKKDNWDTEFEVEGDFFYHLSIASTCAHLNDPRFNMPAIHMTKINTCVVGTDSNVMYIKEFPIKSNIERVVMVSSNFTSCCKSFQESKISIGEKFIKVEYKDQVIISLLSEQRFPNYRAVIREGINWNITANREELKLALQSVSVAEDNTTKVMNLFINDNIVKINAVNTELNKEAETELEIENTVGKLEISFNSSKMMHFISTLTSEKIDLSFFTNTTSIFIKPSDDDSVLCLVQPFAK